VTEPRRKGRRERQAEQTREEILLATRALFGKHGYGTTTIKDIAAAAEVSVQTVYDSVGSKSALLLKLNDLIDREAGVAQLGMAAVASGEAGLLVSLGARITRSILDTCGDIVRVVVGAAADEPDLARVLAEGHVRHLAGANQVVRRLQQMGVLSAASEDASREIAESMAAMTDFELGLLLRDRYGWPGERVEAWMNAGVEAALAPHRAPAS
jgi:AcrR family transcriptional regulator